MRNAKFSFFICLFLFAGCASYSSITLLDEIPTNELPMYGNTTFTAKQQAANEWFINYVTEKAGSREKASEEMAKLGWYYLYRNQPTTAMKRFNQAWLLDKDNSAAYWGFGVLLGGYDKPEEASEMLEKALSLDPENTRLMGDIANSYVRRAESIDVKSQGGKDLIIKADAVFQKATAQKPDACIYAQWAVLSYLEGNNGKCLEKIKKAKELGPHGKECDFITEYEAKCKSGSN